MNAIIIYDDFELATKANKILGNAMWHADTTAQWQVKPWRVNVLTVTGNADAALSDTPGAHHCRFLVDGQWRDDPECTVRVPNTYGSQDTVRQVI